MFVYAQKHAHVYTHSFENSSRLWFPCIDAHSEVCPWDISIVAPGNMMAVSCGELTDVVRRRMVGLLCGYIFGGLQMTLQNSVKHEYIVGMAWCNSTTIHIYIVRVEGFRVALKSTETSKAQRHCTLYNMYVSVYVCIRHCAI